MTRCYYGHLHGGSHRLAAVRESQDGMEYHLVAADYLRLQARKNPAIERKNLENISGQTEPYLIEYRQAKVKRRRCSHEGTHGAHRRKRTT